jgi:hypothetical protein
MFSFLRRLFRGPRLSATASYYVGQDNLPDNHHCTVRAVLTLEEDLAHDLLFLSRVTYALIALHNREVVPRNGSERGLIEDLNLPMGRFGRRALPESLTGGAEAELAEFTIPYHCVERDVRFVDINEGLLPCLVEPGERGRVEVQPYGWDTVRGRQKERIALLRQRGGVPVRAVRVHANRALYEPGQGDYPALVLVTFDRKVENDRRYLHELAERLFELKERSPRGRAEADARDIILANERLGVYHRRRRLPQDFTGGPVIYAADFWYHRDFLPGGCIPSKTERTVACLAEPGDEGGIEHIKG